MQIKSVTQEEPLLHNLNLQRMSPNIPPITFDTEPFTTHTYSSRQMDCRLPSPSGGGGGAGGGGGEEKLEKDALGWNEAQLLEAVLKTSTLKAAGRGLAVRGGGVRKRDCSGHKTKKKHHVTAV